MIIKDSVVVMYG